jgi:membrane-bound lytic murein transglycosylase
MAYMKKIGIWLPWLFCLTILLSGCSHQPKPSAVDTAKAVFDERRAAVRSEIKDPAKAAQGSELVDQLERLVKEASNDRKAHDDRIRSLNANYDATEEEFQAAFREFNVRQKDRQDRLLEINQRAKDITTAEEWKALAKVHEEMLKRGFEEQEEERRGAAHPRGAA